MWKKLTAGVTILLSAKLKAENKIGCGLNKIGCGLNKKPNGIN
jgi:hypothetical protein